MRAFEYYQPTQVIFGDGAGRRAGSFARVFGSRALVVSGSSSARMSGALGDVEQSLQAAGIGYEQLEGVPTNPSVSVVDAGAALARAARVDVVVAVGGGSVIDAAKALSVSAVSHLSYRNYLSGVRAERPHVSATLPTIAVPTIPGSGSETNGTSVIVDDISGRKLSGHADLAAPRVALLDPAYAAGAPGRLLSAGCADAMCHALEAALSERASIGSDALAEAAINILRREAPAAVEGDLEPLGRCIWASNLAGQALSLAGSIVTHPLAHPLSARAGAHHGEAVAALEPAVLATFADRWGDAAIKVAVWLGARKPAGSAAATKAILTRLAAWNRKVGVTSSASDLGLAEGVVDAFVTDALASGSRGLANTPGDELTRDELRRVLDNALGVRPHVMPKTLLEQAASAS